MDETEVFEAIADRREMYAEEICDALACEVVVCTEEVSHAEVE